MDLTLLCDAFESGEPIPAKYTGEGEDVSPALHWQGAPAGTQEFALICDDPDAPTPQPWVHWVIYGIPKDVAALPEGLPRSPEFQTPVAARQGTNSWPAGENTGYRGPFPPRGHGVHHYHFKLYALDAPLKLESGVDKGRLLQVMQGRILKTGEIVGTYSR